MKVKAERIIALAKKEMLQIRRDPLSLLFSIWMPLILLILFGYAVNLDIKEIPVAVLDSDQSQSSRLFIDKITSSGYFKIKNYINRPDVIDDMLDAGSIKIAIWIPHDFSENLMGNRKASILAMMDGSDNNTARVAFGYFENAFDALTYEFFPRGKPIQVKDRVWFNPELKSTNFFIPGLMGIIIMITCTVLTALSIVREKERGTIEKLMVTPLRPIEIVLGKLLPYSVIGFVSFLIMVAGGRFIFGVPFNGSFFLLIFCALLFILTGLLYGLFISTLTQSQQVAWMLSMLTTLLPSMILSGFVFLIPSMPWVLQKITYVVPARYFIAIFRGIIIKGNGVKELLHEILPVLLIISVLIYASGRALKERY